MKKPSIANANNFFNWWPPNCKTINCLEVSLNYCWKQTLNNPWPRMKNKGLWLESLSEKWVGGLRVPLALLLLSPCHYFLYQKKNAHVTTISRLPSGHLSSVEDTNALCMSQRNGNLSGKYNNSQYALSLACSSEMNTINCLEVSSNWCRKYS